MSFSRFHFSARKRLSVLALAMASLAVAGCGNDRDEAPRVERGVVAKVLALQTRTDGTFIPTYSPAWVRPGATIVRAAANGLPQIDITTCDYDYNANRVDEGNANDDKAYVRAPDIDSECAVTALDENPANDCVISTGQTRYTSMLGGFEINFVNNDLAKTQNMAIEGLGANIRIVNEAGAEVWNLVEDQLDYQDLVAETANLMAAEGGEACAGKIRSISDPKSLQYFGIFSAGFFGTAMEPHLRAMPPANSQDMRYRFYWNGKDSAGNDVPAGTYTAHFDITVTDTDTGEQWPAPAPIEFTIANAN